MVNNQTKMACFTRHLFFTLLLLLVSTVNGQNISKYYNSSLQGDGMLYFVFPQGGFHNETGGEFIYDITCLTQNDSVTLNFSYFDKSSCDIDSLVFVCANKRYSNGVNKIFIETQKDKWHYRYTSKILFTDLYNFFSQSEEPKIILYTKKEGDIVLRMKEKKWKKQSAVTKKILDLITYNQ